MSIISVIIKVILKVMLDSMERFALSLISILEKFITGLPSLPGKIGAMASKLVGKFSGFLIEGFSTALLNFGGFAENIVNTIVESISGFVQGGSVVTSPLTLGVSGAVGGTISKILEFIIVSTVSIIVAGTVIYITAYGLYTMLYYIFHLFAGIFIAKLLALVFITLFLWVTGKVFKYFSYENVRDLVIGIGSKLLRPIIYIYRKINSIFRRPIIYIYRKINSKFRGSERKISGGGNVINDYNYEIHIQILTLFFSSVLIIALLNKVYELYYEKEEEVKEEDNDNDD